MTEEQRSTGKTRKRQRDPSESPPRVEADSHEYEATSVSDGKRRRMSYEGGASAEFEDEHHQAVQALQTGDDYKRKEQGIEMSPASVEKQKKVSLTASTSFTSGEENEPKTKAEERKEIKKQSNEDKGKRSSLSPTDVLLDQSICLSNPSGSHFTTPFYTCQNGPRYKMQLDIYGKKKGSTTEMLLYAYIMLGENDSDLKWPLNATIEVEVCNNQRQTIKMLSGTWERVTHVGVQRGHNQRLSPFLTQEELDHYLNDHSLHLRVTKVSIK